MFYMLSEATEESILTQLGGYIADLFTLVGEVFNGVWNLPMEIGKISIACSFLGLAIGLYHRFVKKHG